MSITSKWVSDGHGLGMERGWTQAWAQAWCGENVDVHMAWGGDGHGTKKGWRGA